MAYQIPVKYFNSFWLKKVVGDTNINPKAEIEGGGGTYDEESTVTTTVQAGGNPNDQISTTLNYVLPTWPGIPWGEFLSTPNQGVVEIGILM